MDALSKVAAFEAKNEELESQLLGVSTGTKEKIAIRNQITANTQALSQLYALLASTTPAGELLN